jgi:2-polyprenyl-6-methoxyphenol hydroxylase-like FAD-dependent oxidoreductase
MAGLAAARVLADHADEVLIVEADASDGSARPRAGVPQGTQVHALLPAGQIVLERWFPGLTDEAQAGGAQQPTPEQVEFYIDGHSRPVAKVSDVPALVSSRPFLEAIVRRRTLALDAVRLVPGRAVGLILEGSKVTGARYLPDGAAADAQPVELDADLVVDAMGRSSRLADWLARDGWPAPALERMPIKLNYATALFRRDAKELDTPNLVTVSIATPRPGRIARIGGFNAIEGDRWMVLVAGYDADSPGRSLTDFALRCRRDFPGLFGEIAQKCELLGDVVTYHQADSRRRDYGRLDRFPARLLVTGDAVASFNPVYGQGMTSAILHASCLSAYLSQDPDLDVPARRYFELVRIVVDAAWQISAFPDLALPHVPGPYPRGYRIAVRVSEALLAGSVVDDTLNKRLALVTGMLAHPDTLMSAGTVARALRFERKTRRLFATAGEPGAPRGD